MGAKRGLKVKKLNALTNMWGFSLLSLMLVHVLRQPFALLGLLIAAYFAVKYIIYCVKGEN